MAESKHSPLRHLLAIPLEIVVGIYVIADTIVWMVFAPLVRWLSRLQIIKALERAIDSLHPYVILVLLVVPFIIAELAKVYAVYLMGTGVFKIGMTIFIGAYIVSIFVCERILHAGKRKLMTIPWFAFIYTWIMAIKDRILAWFQTTWVWQSAVGLKRKVVVALRGMKERVLAAFGRKPSRVLKRQ